MTGLDGWRPIIAKVLAAARWPRGFTDAGAENLNLALRQCRRRMRGARFAQ
jgi:hypothetical protein